MASVARPVPEAGGRPWRGDDFPAWLSPMLVKELRQGIQSGAFAWTFVGLQAVMFLMMATMLGSAGMGLVADATVAAFWVPVAVAVALVVPLRGLGAIATERAAGNLDLVRLTHLSATRIVVGKWLAIVAQSLLLAVAVLPYLVLRYFFGGVNVVGELVAFGVMLAAAALVAAAAVAASTRPVRERVAIVILILVLGNGLRQVLMFGVGVGGWMDTGLGIALVGLYTVLLLELAAAAIAPPAENHAARKRVLAIGIAAAWLGTAPLGPAGPFALVAGGTIIPLVAIAVEALCERPSGMASIHAPFARHGAAGRLAALLLTPGWATGLVLVTLLGAASSTAMVLYALRLGADMTDQAAAVSMLACAAVVFPLPAIVLFAPTRRQHAIYGLVQLLCLFVLVFQAMASAGVRGGMSPILAPVAFFPPAALVWSFGGDADARCTLGIAAAGVTVVVYLLVAGRWFDELAATTGRVAAAAARVPGPAAGADA